jgi:hypothetical protein
MRQYLSMQLQIRGFDCARNFKIILTFKTI